ncbi:phage tail sheath family protein [Arsukibacterium sp.]|uniref:phage tail sheath family protein n=1 Tax=Arsukibacterium sp. TaxID=1977258 RepID=UPI002FDB7270
MVKYIPPGVYRQQETLLGQPVTAASTSIVAFVGHTDLGPLAQPVLINSFAEYQKQFMNSSDLADEPDDMTKALIAFYGNGGKRAYICRVNNDDYPSYYQQVLSQYNDFSLLVLPGKYWGATDGNAAEAQTAANQLILATLAFCQQVRHCMLLLDTASGYPLDSPASVTALSLPTSSFVALYYPWLSISNPFYHATRQPTAEKTLTLAPSALAAAIVVSTDARFGVHKAPAGVSAKLNGVISLQYSVNELNQQFLNPLGINCIRTLPKLGTVLWGARTLAAQSEPQWRYISVRRTAIFLEQSISQSLHWALSEQNNERLWQAVRRHVSNFMQTLFHAGALQGSKAQQAFFVQCGLGSSMSAQDIEQQQLVLVLGFAAFKPQEFIVIRLRLPMTPPA